MFDESFLRKLERLAILSRRALPGRLQGERRSPKRGQSVEFADFRPYTLGDDIRRIDWNAYARLDRFFIKLFVEEEDIHVHLLVDNSRSMDWGEPNKLRYAARAAGALGYIALTGLDRVSVTALGKSDRPNGGLGYFPPHRGRQQALALFGFLQGLVAGGRTELGPRLRAYAGTVGQPGPLILFSDLFDSVSPAAALPAFQASDCAEGLRALASRGYEITVVHTLASDELKPQLSGDLKLVDVETGAGVEITADYDLLARYRAGVTAWQEEIRRFCGARGIHYVPVETALPFEELLFTWMRMYGVLR